ncbi:MAG: type IV secretion system DNA-binding domain-containing protein [Candidatus Paceibacteria bacterium]
MAFDPEKITFFAKTDARGKEVNFGIKAKDRQRHMYVVGKTGMGKSTLLENMAAQDIQNGEGMAFIDPHGSAAETLLEYIPEHRVNDVIYFAPFDLEHPISFNVMEDVGPDKRHLVVSGLMSTFKKIWVDAWSARMEYILTNALLALIEYPDTTLLSVNRLFSDKVYRNQVVDYIKDPAVKAFWTEEFAAYTDRFAAEALPAIQNKIGQFTGNPLIRNIIGQPKSSFDIREIMDNKKILIMNLSKGLVGETNANLLGSMLTTRIYLAAMSRADLPVATMKTMPNFYFYVDEFQSFANATFANILSEARKYHLNLIIAHQYIEQMEEEVRDAVFGNVGTTVSFRVGPFDAETLETVFTPKFLAADLVNLGFAQIYLTLMIDGIGSQPFSAVTLPPIEAPRVSCKNMVIASSRRHFTKPRMEVEKIIEDLHTPVKNPPSTAKEKPNSTSKSNPNPNSNNQPATSTQKLNPTSSTPEKKTNPRPTRARDNVPARDGQSDTRRPNERERGGREGRGAERSLNPSSRDITAASKKFPLPKASAEQSLGELRAVLAKVAKVENNKPEPKVPEAKATPHTPKSTADLRSAIASLGTQASAVSPSEMPAKSSSQSETTLPVRHSKEVSADDVALAKEVEDAFASLETSSAPATPVTPTGPDKKDIEYILKGAKGERSPFK